MLIIQLIQLGVGLSDADKKNLLFSAIRNGGIIGRLFVSELTLLKSRVMQLGGVVATWADTLDVINRRYADLSAEASTLGTLNGNKRTLKASGSKKSRHYAHFAEDEGSDEKDEPEHALAAFVHPQKKAKKPGTPCTKCGRKGHKASECLSEYTCKKCGKHGHKESNCWADSTCEKCGKKGHVGSVCRSRNNSKDKGGGSGQPPKKGALTAQVMKNAREMSK
jgi:hypothetical protein